MSTFQSKTGSPEKREAKPSINSGNLAEASRLVQLGYERLQAGDLGNARSLLTAALDEDPGSFAAAMNLAIISSRLNSFVAAEAMARRGIALQPEVGWAWSNLGLYLLHQQKYDEAERTLLRSLELDAGQANAHHALGLVRYHQNRADEAMEDIRAAIDLQLAAGEPTRDMRSDLSMATMKAGRLHDGLVMNEVRWDGMLTKQPPWQCGTRWEGEDLRGKHILVHSEQGYGDAVQFARYLPRLKEVGARVTFAVPAALVRLMDGQCGSDEVVSTTDVAALVRLGREIDYHSPLLSVVKFIGVEFSHLPVRASPYLRPAAHPVGRRARVVRGNGFRVGLVWAASPGYQRSRERSVPVEDLVALGSVPGVKLYSLQVDPYRDDLGRTGADNVVTDLGDQVEDFADTVDLARQLDLVVSVDTGPMHAVAAAGVRTWMIQPVSRCWRWFRGAKPWYGCVDEYHQVRPGTWREPVEEMVEDLRRLVRLVGERSK